MALLLSLFMYCSFLPFPCVCRSWLGCLLLTYLLLLLLLRSHPLTSYQREHLVSWMYSARLSRCGGYDMLGFLFSQIPLTWRICLRVYVIFETGRSLACSWKSPFLLWRRLSWTSKEWTIARWPCSIIGFAVAELTRRLYWLLWGRWVKACREKSTDSIHWHPFQ